MKKLIIFFISAVVNLLAVEMSIDTNQSQNFERKKDMSSSLSKSKTANQTSSNDKSISANVDISLYIHNNLDLECINNPLSSNDFGVSYEELDGEYYNENRKAYLENSARHSKKLNAVDGIDEMKVKRYINCLAFAGAKIAQASLNFQNIGKKDLTQKQFNYVIERSITDKFTDAGINKIYQAVLNDLQTKECRFFSSSETIQCGRAILEMTASNTAFLKYQNYSLYGGSDSLYGIKTSLALNVSDANSLEHSVAKTNDSSMHKSSTQSESKDAKTSISAGKFLPQ